MKKKTKMKKQNEKIEEKRKRAQRGVPTHRDGPEKLILLHESFNRKSWSNRGKKNEHPRKKKKNKKKVKKKAKKQWKENEKKMKGNERKWKKMKEYERKWRIWKKMKEYERKWKKMQEHERKWKTLKEIERKWKEMTENRVLVQNVHYSLGNKGSRPGGSPFSPGEEQTFSECALFPEKKGEPPREHPRATRERPASDLRGQVFWRRDISIFRTEMKIKDKRREDREKRREKTRREKKKEKMKREDEERRRWNEMKENIFFLKNARWISPKCFDKKSLSDELFLHFFFESSESDRFSNYLHDSNLIFRAGRINSKGVFRCTVRNRTNLEFHECRTSEGELFVREIRGETKQLQASAVPPDSTWDSVIQDLRFGMYCQEAKIKSHKGRDWKSSGRFRISAGLSAQMGWSEPHFGSRCLCWWQYWVAVPDYAGPKKREAEQSNCWPVVSTNRVQKLKN